MDYFIEMKLSRKLMLMIGLPLVVMTGFALLFSIASATKYNTSSQLQKMTMLSVHTSNLVHELQKERGMTAGYISSKGNKFSTELPSQRQQVSKKLDVLESYLMEFDAASVSKQYSNSLDNAMVKLKEASTIRAGVDSLSIKLKDALGYYTSINVIFLGLVSEMSIVSSDADLAITTAAYANFLQGKERAGIERAVLTGVFSKDQFDGMFNKFMSLVTTQDSYNNVFISLASDKNKEYYKNTMTGEAISETEKMREVAIQKADTGNFGIDANNWFDMQTEKINLLKMIEDNLSADLADKSDTLKSEALTSLIVSILITLVSVIASGWFGSFVGKGIRRQLGGEPAFIESIATQIANGNLDMALNNNEQESTGVYAAMVKMQNQLTTVIEKDIQSIINTARHGDLSNRIKLDNKNGFYKKLSSGINELVDVNEQVVNDTVRMFGAMAEGDLSQRIKAEYRGAFDNLKKDANRTVEKLTQVIEGDIQNLVDAARRGDLTQRISLEDKEGFFNSLSRSINDLVSINEQVVDDTVRMFGSMAQGDLSQRIDANYQGAFNNLKQDANQTVEKLTQVIEGDIQNLVNSARSGDLTNRIPLDNKQGFFETLSSGINDLVEVNERVVDDTVRMFSAMARGDLTQRIDGNYQGAFDQLKHDANQTVGKLTQVIESDIQSLVNAARNGDLTQRINMSDKDGFFKTLSEGVNDLVDVNERVINDSVRVVAAMARGDLTETIDAKYDGVFGKLKSDTNSTIAKLTSVIGEIRTSSGAVVSGASEIASGNADLSQRAEEQASSLEETASSMEEMTSSVQQSAENSKASVQLAEEAREVAQKGGDAVTQAVVAMEAINKSSKEISDIIGVIDEIAFQTNLLALNAAVEAARAGEQGRGFAVVAGEVRNLAQRSADAAKEIKSLISDSGIKVSEGTTQVNNVGEILTNIVQAVGEVAKAISNIRDAADEQYLGIQQVNIAVTQMDEMTQKNAALAEEASAAGDAMSGQASQVLSLVNFFHVGEGGMVQQNSGSTSVLANKK